MKKIKVGIIGGGRFGLTLAESLTAHDVDVTLLDNDWSLIQSLAETNIRAVHGDGTNPSALRNAGFADCNTVVIALSSSIESSSLTTINCKDLQIRSIIAKAKTDLQGRILERIGADIVVYPDRDRAFQLAKAILTHSPVDLYEIATGYSIAEVSAPRSILGKTLIESAVRQNFSITVLAIKRKTDGGKGPRQTLIAKGEQTIEEDDLLVVFGADEAITKLHA